jgi:HK97 family phage major capsid protein
MAEQTAIEKAMEELGKTADANLLKRLEPLQAMVDGIVKGREQEATALAEERLNFQKMFDDQNKTIEDLRKLAKAVRSTTHADGGKYDGLFASTEEAKLFGYFLLGYYGKGTSAHECLTRLDAGGIMIRDVNGEAFDTKALAENVTSTGAALVPDEFIPSLIVQLETHGVFRNAAREVPMASDKQVWPKLTSDVTVYKPGEATAITASNPLFSNIELLAVKLATLTVISSELAEDSALIVGEIVGDSIVRALAKAEDQAGFLGDGTSTYWNYVGLVGAFQSISGYAGFAESSVTGGIVTAAGNAYSEITIGNLNSMCGTLPSFAETAQTAWYMSKRFYWDVVVRLIEGAGGMLKSEYESTQGNVFRGWPVRFVDVMPKVEGNSQFCAYLGDMSQTAFFGNRRQLTVDQDESVYFTSDQLAIRGTERFAINVHGQGTTTVAGPIMALITNAD